jgi:predicted DNA-binding transcriptional regulator YafY
VLIACARERTRCRIQYLKPAAAAPAERVLHPWAVVHAEGRWYVVAWCETSEGARTFRLDRILDAEPCEGRFERPDQVEVEAFLSGGRVYHADHDTEVVVRYSPGVARWIEEWAPAAEPTPGGGLLVRHHISDPGWVVRHVLAYAGEAEVVEPAELRACVVEAVGEGDSPHSNRSMRS